jgi:DNA repair exonuclease SbcCD ATPase subunit
MKLLYVEMENILSIGNIRLDFEDSGLVLMDGWNYDDESANGAGKTAAFLGIPFSIWDKFPRKMTKSEILRKGTKRGYSKVGIAVAGDTYEVIRRRPSKVEFYKNGVAVDMTQAEFEAVIGLSYSQYLICMYSPQTEGKKLIALNDSEKKDFILKLMDLERFSTKKKEADAVLKGFYKDRSDREAIISMCDAKLDVYNEQSIDISSVTGKITQLDYSSLEKKLVQCKAVPAPDTSKFDDLKSKISDRRTSLDTSYRDQMLVLTKLTSAKDELANIDHSKINCPECNTDIVPGSSVVDRKAVLKDRISGLTKQYNSYPNFETSKAELSTLLNKANVAQRKEEEEWMKARERIAELQSKISLRKASIQALNEQIDESRIRMEKINELESYKTKANNDLADINSDIEIWETVSMTLAPTGAPAYIMDAVVDVFNEKISEYTSDIWANASYRIQSYKENKSGDIKAKFSDRLVVAGRDRSIGSLSGGEYKCLSLAVDFAIMDVIESMFGIYMSPIVLDEPFEGLDTSNRERVISLLEKRSQKRQIWVIDHASEAKAMFSKIMCIEKRGGISRLVI